MLFRGLEVGSWAEWFSGILTALGIYIGIRSKKVRIKLDHEYDEHNYIITVENSSDMDIVLGGVFLHVYSKKFGKNVLRQYQNPITDNTSGKEAPYVLKTGGKKGERFVINPPDIGSDIKKEYKKVYIRYGASYNGDSVKEKLFRRKIKFN